MGRQEFKESVARQREILGRYKEMKAKVDAWQAPTEEQTSAREEGVWSA